MLAWFVSKDNELTLKKKKSSRIKNAFEGLKILPQGTGFQATRCRLCA